MFTGKRPTDDIFDNNMNLHNYVKMALPQNVAEITDPTLVEGIEDDARSGEKVIESLIAIFEIGVACSEDMPRERMDISDALPKLIAISNNQQQVNITCFRLISRCFSFYEINTFINLINN